MRWLRKLLSFPLAVLAIPVLWLALTWQILAGTVLQPDWVKQTVADSKAYQAIPALVAESLTEGLAESDLPFAVSTETVRGAVDRRLPAAVVRDLVTPVIDRGYAWLGSDAPAPDLSVDLQTVRARLRPAVADLLDAGWQSLPLCTPEQLPKLTAAAPERPLCRPPADAGVPLPFDAVDLVAHIPASVDLAPVLERIDPAIWQRLAQVRPAIVFVEQRVWVAWLVLLAWLGLLVGVNLDWWYTPLGWIGWPLLLGGAGLALGGVAAKGVYPLVLSDRLPGSTAGRLLGRALESLLAAVSERFWQYGLAFAAAGLLVVVVLIAAAIAVPAPADQAE